MCDLLCALPHAAEGVTLFAKNSDRPPPQEAQLLEWLPARVDEGMTRATYVALPALAEPTFGVLGSRPVTGMDLVRLVLERAPDAEQAVSLLAELLTSDPMLRGRVVGPCACTSTNRTIRRQPPHRWWPSSRP